jgi:hypothetical protein
MLEVAEIQVCHAHEPKMPVNARHVELCCVGTVRDEKTFLHTTVNIVYSVFLFIDECQSTATMDDSIHVVGDLPTVKGFLLKRKAKGFSIFHNCQWPLHYAAIL